MFTEKRDGFRKVFINYITKVVLKDFLIFTKIFMRSRLMTEIFNTSL